VKRLAASPALVALNRRLNQFSGMDEQTEDGGVAVAVQGGGAHGAFAWGVLDGLLDEGVRIDAICGVSSGAIIATMLAQGMARGGPDAARAEMRKLWRRISQAHSLSPLQNGPLQRWLWGWDLSVNPLWQGIEAAQLNPFGHNPLRHVLDELLDRRLLAQPSAPRLTVAATDVETGEAVLFDNAAITVDVLLASACLPFVFPAVEIGGRAFWDGGYAGNPPLRPLLRPRPPRDLVLIRAQPGRRPGVPKSVSEIMNRLNEIACHNVLTAELAGLPASVRLTTYDADDALLDLPISSKFNGEADFLSELFDAGRAAAAAQELPGRRANGMAERDEPRSVDAD
jgi:NTE family protein